MEFILTVRPLLWVLSRNDWKPCAIPDNSVYTVAYIGLCDRVGRLQ